VGDTAGASARESSPDDRFERIRELRSHETPTFLARMRDPGGAKGPGSPGVERLVVLEQFSRAALGDSPIEPLVAASRVIAALHHTNLARVREFRVGRDVITTVTDFIDGELLSELFDEGTRIPPRIALRIVLDVCTGLTVLRALREPGGQPMPTTHGEVVGSNILIGLDGNARLMRAGRVRAELRRGASTPEALPLPKDFASLAPEVLEGHPADGRSDVYSVGVLLWQALSGEALFGAADAPTILGRLRSGDVPPARISADEPWAAPMADLIARTLEADPVKRLASAGMLAVELRKIAGANVATAANVSAFVKEVAGEKIAARRAALEPVNLEDTDLKPASIPPLAAAATTVDPPAREPAPALQPAHEPKVVLAPALAPAPAPKVIVAAAPKITLSADLAHAPAPAVTFSRRASMPTQPSILVQSRAHAARRRTTLLVAAVVGLAFAAVLAWRFVPQRVSASGPSVTRTKPTEPAPTATPSAPRADVPREPTTGEPTSGPAPTDTGIASQPEPPATGSAAAPKPAPARRAPPRPKYDPTRL
jgi:eukaryotic-like serine/threonine-protein kinase